MLKVNRFNFLVFYMAMIILVYLVTNRFSINIIIYNVLILVLIILWGIFVLYITYNYPYGKFQIMLLIIVLVSALELSCIFKIVDMKNGFVRIWHYFYDIEAIKKVSSYGHIGVLISYFDNFGSSPGTPILSAILHIITGLAPLFVFSYYGIVIFISMFVPLLFLLSKLIVQIAGHNFYIRFGFIFLIGLLIVLPLIMFLYKVLIYGFTGISILLLILYYIFKFIYKRNIIKKSFQLYLTFILLIFGEAVHYLPYAWTLMLLLISVLITILLLGNGKIHKPREHYEVTTYVVNRLRMFLFLILITVSVYTLYWGIFFFSDLNTAINMLIRSFRPAIHVAYPESRLIEYGAIEVFVIYLTRIYTILLPIISLISMIFILRRLSNIIIYTLTIFATFILGLTYLRFFIHIITDYTLRLNPLAVFLFIIQIVIFLLLLNNSKPVWYKKFLCIIIIILYVSSLGNYINMLIIYSKPRYSFDINYHIYDSYVTSLFILKHIDSFIVRSNTFNIYGDYRYGYIKSIGQITIHEYNSYHIQKLIKNSDTGDTIIIITKYNVIFPNKSGYILDINTFKTLQQRFNLIYNSIYSYVIGYII